MHSFPNPASSVGVLLHFDLFRLHSGKVTTYDHTKVTLKKHWPGRLPASNCCTMLYHPFDFTQKPSGIWFKGYTQARTHTQYHTIMHTVCNLPVQPFHQEFWLCPGPNGRVIPVIIHYIKYIHVLLYSIYTIFIWYYIVMTMDRFLLLWFHACLESWSYSDAVTIPPHCQASQHRPIAPCSGCCLNFIFRTCFLSITYASAVCKYFHQFLITVHEFFESRKQCQSRFDFVTDSSWTDTVLGGKIGR